MQSEVSAIINSIRKKRESHLRAGMLNEEDVILVSRALKGSNVKELILNLCFMGNDGCEHLSRSLPDTRIEALYLLRSDIGDEGAKHLGECLKHSRISILQLGSNDIGDEGAACLAQGLVGSQVQTLGITDNSIGDEGLKAFAKVLNDTQINTLTLKGNEIHRDGARTFNKILCDTKLQEYSLHVFTSGGRIEQSMRTEGEKKEFHVSLEVNDVGPDEVEYLIQFFNLIPRVHELTIFPRFMTEKGAQYLAEAVKDLEIVSLSLEKSFSEENLVQIPDDIKYLTQTFRSCQITEVDVEVELKSSEALNFVEFLKGISVISLCFRGFSEIDSFIAELALTLKTSTLLYLSIVGSKMSPILMESLVQILRNNPITHLDLGCGAIGDAGVECLARALKYTQLTHIDLRVSDVTQVGCRRLAEVIDDSNVCCVRLSPESRNIRRNETNTEAYKICHAFKTLVGLNRNWEFQFVLPKKMHNSVVSGYVYLIKVFIDNPFAKAHIFHTMCFDNRRSFDYDTMVKINTFTQQICEKFNEFFNDNVLAFSPCDPLEMIKKFENKQLSAVVQNLLLHRELFYVDSNKEILHPLIYRLLHRYKMPLYNDQLEPNKREAIIAFYANHLDEDVRELMQLLI